MLLDFMGEKPRMIGPDDYVWNDSPFFYCRENNPDKVMDYMAEYAKYDSDWTWLMRVLEKICRTKIGDGEKFVDYAYPYTFGMLSEDGKIMVRLHGFPVHLADTLLEATYEAVCEVVEHIIQNKLV